MKRFISPLFLFFSMGLTAAIVAVTSYTPGNQFKRQPIDNIERVLEISSTNEWVETQLAKMSLKEKIGQFFMIASSSNKSEEHFQEVDSLILNNKVGGVIFFQGERQDLKIAIDRYQSKSEIPLLIAMDAEWGVGMRLIGEDRFPYNYTLGAANDPELTEKIGAMIAQECRDLGIHINFAPVADVNSNPNNPVIGFRSFGENPVLVGNHVAATVKGMEGQGVLTSIKHFPGHGDTDVDSHYDLPIVNNSYAQINAIDFSPFRAGIDAGASTVMIGHLNVPALDPSGTPSSLSKATIQNHLKRDMGFKGLVVSDALRMKAVADRYGKVEAVVMAFEAGIDILLMPESVEGAIDAIAKRVEEGAITEEEINTRCSKVLMAKYTTIIAPNEYKTFTEGEISYTNRATYDKAITILKNAQNEFPIQRFDKKIALVCIGEESNQFRKAMTRFGNIDIYHAYSGFEASKELKGRMANYDLVLTAVHTSTVLTKDNFGLPKSLNNWIDELPSEKRDGLILFGNPLALRHMANFDSFNSVLVAYENNDYSQERAAEVLFGTIEVKGKLPITVNELYKRGDGLQLAATGRLKRSQPEELGLAASDFSQIDSIVMKGIRAGAFPGCQILVAYDGKIIYEKGFGYHTYDQSTKVETDDIYDIASITKIAASTTALMRLQSEDKFDLNLNLENYLPELTKGTSYAGVQLKEMLAHQAGFHPWISFHGKTMRNGELRSDIYQKSSGGNFTIPVTEKLYLRNDYIDSIYRDILRTPLNEKKYKYSDLGYYFVKRIVEKQSGRGFDDFLMKEFYLPLGLRHMRYNPTKYFKLSSIAPTEKDMLFRNQQIHGYVHDQGAALMGGVGGHAGLFSNAHDLAQLMQLFLNAGKIGNDQYIEAQVIDQYTSYQYYPTSRRGAGFDKPSPDGSGGTCSSVASLKSFGHSGFTGTLTWADPETKINYVFLSNRVYPDAENWKIVNMNIRTDIQQVIYKILAKAK